MSQRKARAEENAFVLEGWRSLEGIMRINQEAFQIELICISDQFNPPSSLPPEVEVIRLPEPIFNSITDLEQSPGILTVINPRKIALDWTLFSKILLLDRIRDPGNLGTLIRSAVGAGYDAILLYGDCVDPTNPKVLRASMGTFPRIPIVPCSSDLLTSLQQKFGMQLIGLICREGTPIRQLTTLESFIVALGSEANGLAEELISCCDQFATIEIEEACESLNVAVAGSVAMFTL
tara:strand:- start:721 stop:1425 length:705 start_codon:yes stop_codon:yes gene_type:complete